ncbi:STAS/SEC14 domain-containing protein [uncultured Microbacterium sp.]|jgi:methionine synthase II (cobalamin-independent)|uniref:STAS/SEC14 domain-containing protein n=1 Tax=uncultured Microbacterium sp. TaxID=191216 RepID=UPI0028D318B7|nr:STAS/SEC14 domain-containing protein [uncultured Microbacterium sp.]
MIELLPDLPDTVIGFRAVGTVEASDYESVIDPAIDATIAAGRKVNLVFVLDDGFERYSMGAMWQDALLESKPGRSWGRIALVTDHAVIGEVIHGIAFLFPGEVRIFAVAAQAEAVRWAAEGPQQL